jgi:YHS domain-containing protein
VALRIFLIVVMVLLAIRAFGRLFGGVAQGSRGAGSGRPRAQGPAPVKMTQDPVCGTFVVPGKALSLTAGDATHWFCSERCRAEYSARS